MGIMNTVHMHFHLPLCIDAPEHNAYAKVLILQAFCELCAFAIDEAVPNPCIPSVWPNALSSSLQIADNLGALAVLPKLTPEVLEKIEAAVETKPEAPATYR